MASVTQIIKTIKQPYGGFLKQSLFNKQYVGENSDYIDSENESAHSSLIGLAVDYLTRLVAEKDIQISDAFKISIAGFDIFKAFILPSLNISSDTDFDQFYEWTNGIDKGLSDEAINYALNVVKMEVFFRTVLSHEQLEQMIASNHFVCSFWINNWTKSMKLCF